MASLVEQDKYILEHIGSYLQWEDVCNLSISKWMYEVFSSNLVWNVIYRRNFNIMCISSTSIHSDAAWGPCHIIRTGCPCYTLSHYSGLTEKTEGLRNYKNFKRQFGKRMKTKDKRTLANFRTTANYNLDGMIARKNELINSKIEQIKDMEQQVWRYQRVRKLRAIGVDAIYEEQLKQKRRKF
jgi:hypothetical protein